MTLMSSCGPEKIRTSDTWFRKPLLYPLSYGARADSVAVPARAANTRIDRPAAWDCTLASAQIRICFHTAHIGGSR